MRSVSRPPYGGHVLAVRDLVDAVTVGEWSDRNTVDRGRSYAAGGRVLETEVERDAFGAVRVLGVVIGSRAYRTQITATALEDGVHVSTSCSCPVGWFCKHVVATVLVAAESDPTEAHQGWRRSLEAILDELPEPDELAAVVPVTALALQVVVGRAPRASRYASAPHPYGHPRLSLRPVRMGASGRWVKSGVGWRQLTSAAFDHRTRYDPDQLDLLIQLQVAVQGSRNYWSGADDAIDLHDAGAAIWPLLHRASALGLAVLSSEPATTVRVATEQAALELDLSARDERVSLRPGAVLDDRWYDADDVGFIGQQAHGVILWDVEGDPPTVTLAALDRRPSPSVRGWFARADDVTVPAGGVDELLTDYLPRMRTALAIGSRDGTVAMPEPATVGLRARLVWHDDASATLTWLWRYTYGEQGPRRQFPVDDPHVGGLTRDRYAEQSVLDRAALSEPLASYVGIGRYGPATLVAEQRARGRDAMELAEKLLPELVEHPLIELEIVGDPPDFREATGVPVVRFADSDGDHRDGRTDWLELEIVVSIDDAQLGTLQIGLADVLTALTTGETTVMVGRGVFVSLDRPELDRLAQLVADAGELVEQPRGGLRLSRDQHDLLASVAEIGPTEGQVLQWVQAAATLQDLDPADVPPDPAGLTATLRPYQRDGYQWLTFLHEHGLGGVLADDMGLGKTVQTLAMIARAREAADPDADPPPPFLVVAPSSVVGTWVAEARTFTPGLRVVPVTESRARRGWELSRVADPACPVDIVVTTYTLLRIEADDYSAQPWAGLILDEAQSVKNHLSKTYAAARALDAGSRFAITGTPMENNLMELWSVLSLAAPGLFPYAARFKDRFAKPIEQGRDADTLASLRRRIRPVMLRRTKDLVAADLPAKQEQVLEVELSPRHRRLYDTHLQRERQRILKLLDDLDENRITILASLTRLRQLSLDPALVDAEHESIGSAKIDTLIEHLTEIAAEGHRALVFSQFTGFLARIRTRLDAAGLSYSYLDGRTRKRPQVIDGFKTGTDPVFLISLKAGGVGLTLTEADYCFLLDPWWNPAVEAQAIDRTHRIGQTRNVVVYRLVSAGTIEQKVMELAQRKAALFASVLDADSMMSTALTAADIAGLLGGADDPMTDD